MTTPRQTMLPSATLALWVVVFLILCLSQWRLVLIGADGDTAWHWRSGNWMLEHHSVIRADPFSHTKPGAPCVSKDWLSEIAIAVAGNSFGWAGITALAAAAIATTLALLHRHLLATNADPAWAAALVILAGWTASNHWLARPHLATHLLFVVFAMKLDAFHRGQLPAGKLFGWLVPLMIVWANVHGAFLAGLVLIGCYAVADARHRQALGWLLAACAAASLVNPYGVTLHAHIVEFLRHPDPVNITNEWRAPDFHSAGMRGFLATLAVLAALLIVARPKLAGLEIVLVLVWGCFAFKAVRNVPLFGLAVAPILARHLSAWRSWPGISERLRLQTIPAAVVVWVAVAMWLGVTMPETTLVRDRFPVEAVAWLRQHPEAVRGEMFHPYGWGGYLMWALPERKVFVDGRNDFYGNDFMKEFDKADDVKDGYAQVLEHYRVGWTILPLHHRLNRLLELQPDQWKELYRDDVAIIHARTSH